MRGPAGKEPLPNFTMAQRHSPLVSRQLFGPGRDFAHAPLRTIEAPALYRRHALESNAFEEAGHAFHARGLAIEIDHVSQHVLRLLRTADYYRQPRPCQSCGDLIFQQSTDALVLCLLANFSILNYQPL